MALLKRLILTIVLISTVVLGGCSSTDDNAYEYGVYDPWESYNRKVFAFNEGFDYILLDPIAKGYRFVVPGAFRTAISNFLFNLKHPFYLVNELLQGDMEGAGLVTKRFVFNTFTGFGGILDTASWEGMTYEGEDFGQTLAVWGVDSGPYMVLPFWGPSSLRDSSGLVAGFFMDPVNWYLYNHEHGKLDIALILANGLVAKEELMDLQSSLRDSSVDYYATIRSVWTQRRNAVILDGQDLEYDDYE